MIQTPNTTGKESGGGAMYFWGWMTRVMKPHNKTTKGTQTNQDLLPGQTITGTSETLCSASSSWATQTRPSRRVRNTTFIFRLSWTFSCQGCGRPSGCRGWGLCHFLKHPYVAVTSHGPMVAPAKTRVTEKWSSISCLAGLSIHGTWSF